MRDVIIAGGGIIGLAAARELALSGHSVLVLDRGNTRDAASWAAAGMLAPQSEADEPNPFFDLCLASARLYHEWADRLHEESGIDPEYADSGLLCLASTENALCRLQRVMQWQTAAGLTAEILSAEDVRRLEPGITLPIVGALHLPAECHVTPRQVLDAVTGACAVKGVEIRSGVHVTEILHRKDRVIGVKTVTERIEARCVIVASGVHTPEIEGLVPPIPVVPRKGQILSLMARPVAFQKMIRWEQGYMVQRRSGELVVGATNEDAGFDRSITPAGIGGLLEQAQRISSSLGGLPIHEMWTGLRPATPDGFPIIGKSGIEGLLYATGHYRNGILLAPITAACVAALVENRPAPVDLKPYSPSPFGRG